MHPRNPPNSLATVRACPIVVPLQSCLSDAVVFVLMLTTLPGRCNNFTKSKSLRRAVGTGRTRATQEQDAQRLFSHVRELLMAIAVPPSELRGVGICMSKLSVVRPPEPRTTKPETSTADASTAIDVQKSTQEDSARQAELTISNSRSARTPPAIKNAPVDLSSPDSPGSQLTWTQVDLTVLDALPNDIRQQQVAHLNDRRARKRKKIETKPPASPLPWWHSEV